MPDALRGNSETSSQRSWNMSRIRGKDTSIELLVRRYLFKAGFRYRLNSSKLPGKPDIVLKKYNTVIFVNGCFWHRHQGCKYCTTPNTNHDFWNNKFNRNIENDKKNYKLLSEMEWNILIIWECELNNHNFENRMKKLINQITNI